MCVRRAACSVLQQEWESGGGDGGGRNGGGGGGGSGGAPAVSSAAAARERERERQRAAIEVGRRFFSSRASASFVARGDATAFARCVVF